jgi:asparagine synthase (glutamine-hydrolysing)
MCGIAGFFNQNAAIGPHTIRLMTDTLRHRGPDDEGYLAANTLSGSLWELTGPASAIARRRIEEFREDAILWLGHRRLSIIDLSAAGHQPMTNAGQWLWIVYNGEIYNFIELREELKGLGHIFRTNTDTEVLLAAYERWGKECVHKFNGMWAFVIYDRRKNVLFGSRDRFGVKPLYYFFDGKQFAFASEIKALMKLPCMRNQINPAALFDYLVLDVEEKEEEGLFKDIFELFPSHSFEFNLQANSFSKWRYFRLEYEGAWHNFNKCTFDSQIDILRVLISDAIRIRLRSDVMVGSCLSGGIDSSSIVCIVNDLMRQRGFPQIGDTQKVFTACYYDARIDESKWAKIVADGTAVDWLRTFPTKGQLWDDLEDLIYTQDLPFGSTSIYAQFRVMKLVRESGVKVLLDGQGGDELFSGYPHYYRAFFLELIRKAPLARLVSEYANLHNAPISRSRLFLLSLKTPAASVLPGSTRSFLIKNVINENRYISSAFWNENQHRLAMFRDMLFPSLNQMLHFYMTGQNLKTLLRYEDRNSMRFSIEARAPFADDINLINHVFQIPSTYKIHNGWSKYLLRESMRGLLPAEIHRRKDKIGFSTPQTIWLRELKSQLQDTISGDLGGFIDAKRLLKDWDQILDGRHAHGADFLWRLVNFALWKKVYAL